MQLLFIRLFLKKFLIPFTMVCIEIIGTYPGFCYENDHFREQFWGRFTQFMYISKFQEKVGLMMTDCLIFFIKDDLSHRLKNSHSEVFDTYFVHHFTVVCLYYTEKWIYSCCLLTFSAFLVTLYFICGH